MRHKNRKLLFCLTLLLGFLLILTISTIFAWASGSGGNSTPQNPYPDNLLYQGWGIWELQLPGMTDPQSTGSMLYPDPHSPDYQNTWYVDVTWGANPTDGRGSLYLNDVAAGESYVVDPNLSYLNAINAAYQRDGIVWPFYNSSAGAWELYNLYAGRLGVPSTGFLNSHQTWFYANGGPGTGSQVDVADPQSLSTSDGGAVSNYYDQGFWLLNPATNTPDTGNGMAPGWFGQLAVYPPDIQIQLTPNTNGGGPVAAGQTVTGSYTISNGGNSGSLVPVTGTKVNIYMTDAAGNLLQQIGSISQPPLNPAASNGGTFNWTMPSGQPSGVQIWASADEELSFTGGRAITYRDTIQLDPGSAWTMTNEDYDWSNNMTNALVPAGVGQPTSGNTTGFENDGYAVITTTTQTPVNRTYQVTPMGVEVPVNVIPPPPPHYYLSY